MSEEIVITNRSLAQVRQKYVPSGVSVQNSIVITRAQGARMWDDEDREYVDFAGGIGCLNVGSAHPEVVEAIKRQADQLLHTCFHVTMNAPYLQLVEKLCDLTPIAGDKKAMLANSGAEAVENAIKIARSYTKRSAVIAFEYAFHGRTQMTLSLTSKVHPYKAGFGPFSSEVYRLPYANCYRCPFGQEFGQCRYECIDAVKKAFTTHVAVEDVAAVIIEPVQGEGGFIVPPPDYLPLLRQICKENGILFIVDEVQTGFGRTGKLFSTQHYENLDPDLITMAKSLGAGLPISAVVGKREIMDSTEVGGLGGTYGGNPLSAAAALKVIEIMERDQLAQRAQVLGEMTIEYLRRLQRKFPMIGDVRGQGAMIAMEFITDAKSKVPFPEAVAMISQKCLAKGLITVKAGVFNHVIRFLYPLVITTEELQLGLQRMEEAICETALELQQVMIEEGV
ncbi:4-aminobutyrate--2-oxoglutarate transaminase [Sulfoacidibacillus thermotolerans]|uniref:(S)-3-amino-2-methylpropionate transaminase n=1 Tax=Sulfoacidibacillus thermotolerans TaxID=1765684 RepID=A0A2U3D1B7_SULT2|nr:4-aminobutyrate--2-oxoglutarate transaminase [Sulfoacidibacillus thermotolerans]PWI55035.1 4-aminobutyrate transaminase [Sulfoacidibacillus thermotolerans]